MNDKGFDGKAFFAALEATVLSRGLTWKSVSQETGVSASTLTRMARGRGPDAASLAALAAWAGLNPTEFVRTPHPARPAEPMARISALLRSDPELDAAAATALETIVRTAYAQLKKGT